MKKNTNLVRNKYIVTVYVAIMSLLSSLFISYYLISKEYKKYVREQELLSTRAKSMALEELNRKMEETLSYIDYKKMREEILIKEDLKGRVTEFYNIIQNIYKENGSKGITYNINLIKKVFKQIKFNDGRGYYFAIDYEGNALSHGGPLSLEGTNLLHNKETHHIIQGMIDKLKHVPEGYFEYEWYNPNDKEKKIGKKMAYLKRVPQLNFFIGTGEYLNFVSQKLKREVKNRIEAMKVVGGGQMMVIDLNEKVKEKTTKNNPHFFQIETLYPEWNWKIIALTNINSFNQNIDLQKKQMLDDLKHKTIFIILITIGLIIFLSFPFIGTINALNQSERLKAELENIFKFSGDAFLVIDSDGNILKSNDIATSHFKFIPKTNLNIYLNGSDFKNLLRSLSDSKKNLIKHYKTIHQDTFIALSVSLIRNNKKEGSEEYSIIVRDMTDYHKKEEALLYAQKKSDMESQIKTNFMNNIGHEIKTPVNAIQGLSEVLGYETNFENIKKYTQIIKKNSTRLTKVIDKILDVSRKGENHQVYRSVDLNNILNQLIIENNEYFFEKRVTANSNFTNFDNLKLVGDEFLIKQLMGYVLENAYKFSQNGHIDILANQAPVSDVLTKISLSFKNQGVSLTPKHQKKLLMPFEQSDDSASRIYQGMGLGLTLAQDIAKEMNGDVHIETLDDISTIVTVSFELLRENGEESTKNNNFFLDNHL